MVLMNPAVSVVLPVFNAASYLDQSIVSILDQEFKNFELILIDDGSTDESSIIINKYSCDPRVRIIKNKTNIGLIKSLHQAYSLSRAELIARMDADDISNCTRLGRQMSYLRDNPEVSILGGAIKFFGNGLPHVFQFPLKHVDIWPAMLFYCPLAHPAVMFRRRLFDEGLFRYDDDFTHAEDYHLWSRLLLHTKSANLPDVILSYRLHSKQVSSDSSHRQYSASLRVRLQMLENCGISPNESEIALHESVLLERPLSSGDYLQQLARWYSRLEEVNRFSQYWDARALEDLLKAKFFDTALRVGANLKKLTLDFDTNRYIDLKNLNAYKIKYKHSFQIKHLIKKIYKACHYILSKNIGSSPLI